MAKQTSQSQATDKRTGKSEDMVGTAERIIRLLQFVAERGQFSLKDVSAALRLPPSTVHRMLQLLMRFDLVDRDDQLNYRVSREYYRIGSLAVDKFDLNTAARPHLEEMSRRTNETVSFALYLPKQRLGMIVDTIPTKYPLQYWIEPFTTWSLAWGSLGRAMLAYLPDEDVTAILESAPPSPATGQPVPTKESLATEFAGIRALGHYVSINQNVLGATGTAAVVLGLGGQVIGSIGVTIPVARYRPEAQPEVSEMVTRHARELSASLGYKGEPVPQAVRVTPLRRTRRRASTVPHALINEG